MTELVEPIFVEFFGTFIFLSVILETSKAIPIALTLAAMIFWGGSISGGHFNPAVSIMMFLNGKKNLLTTLLYIVAQVAGGILALYFVSKLTKK
jgi:aquaporin Z